jgi:hypothetical protein
MTARERINDHPTWLHPSRRRAVARIAKLRSDSHTSHRNTFPKMQNKTTSDSTARVRAAGIVVLPPTSSLKSRLAHIEIP